MFAERGAELAQRSEDLARRATEVAERRRKAGEITDLDANLARSALGRARAASQAARSEHAAALGRLGALVGAGPEDILVLRGDLRPPPLPDVHALRAHAASRPDVRVLDTERVVAAAEGDQAQANALPQSSTAPSWCKRAPSSRPRAPGSRSPARTPSASAHSRPIAWSPSAR